MISEGQTRLPVIGAVLAILAVGCGGPFDASLKGIVTLDGEALNTGTVTLQPTESNGSTAHGRIDEGGNYRIQTGREYGLDPGRYLVTVVAREAPESLYGPNGGPPPAGKLLTPRWYRSTTTSGLSVDVKPGGNDYSIQLTSNPPPGW